VSRDHEWFALQVRTRTERQVATILQSKGYEEFLPIYRVQRKRGPCAVPLFPGYVFCRVNPHACGLIVTTPGVIRFVEFGGRPAAIDPEEIKSIQLILSSGAPTYVLMGLHLGDRVCIQAGPLRGAIGVLTSMRAKQRLVVSITMMMRTIAAEVDPEWVAVTAPVSKWKPLAAPSQEVVLPRTA
jgi:transcription antitermination factor NusG